MKMLVHNRFAGSRRAKVYTAEYRHQGKSQFTNTEDLA